MHWPESGSHCWSIGQTTHSRGPGVGSEVGSAASSSPDVGSGVTANTPSRTTNSPASHSGVRKVRVQLTTPNRLAGHRSGPLPGRSTPWPPAIVVWPTTSEVAQPKPSRTPAMIDRSSRQTWPSERFGGDPAERAALRGDPDVPFLVGLDRRLEAESARGRPSRRPRRVRPSACFAARQLLAEPGADDLERRRPG